MAWTKTVEEHGVTVRLYDRGRTIYRAVKLDRVESENGQTYTKTDRKSLGTSDRKHAEQLARQLAAQIAKARLTGQPTGRLTFGQLRAAYRAQRLPMLTDKRQCTVTRAMDLLQRHLGVDFPIVDFDQHAVDGYVQARTSGCLCVDDYRARDGVGLNTIREELRTMSTVCNWAVGRRVGGQPLLPSNPVKSLDLPNNPNVMRPRATPERYAKLVEVANDVDPSGQFRLMLEVAWRTGRRINAILHLRASDILLTTDAVRSAMAEAGQDETLAAQWDGGIRWAAEWDKVGLETFSPMPAALRPIIVEYMRSAAVIGAGWVFLYANGEPADKNRAGYLLGKAEKAAGLPKQTRGGWHAFRRGWATLRKSLPVPDVMAAGGWKDATSLQRAYQGADSATVRSVVDLAESA